MAQRSNTNTVPFHDYIKQFLYKLEAPYCIFFFYLRQIQLSIPCHWYTKPNMPITWLKWSSHPVSLRWNDFPAYIPVEEPNQPLNILVSRHIYRFTAVFTLCLCLFVIRKVDPSLSHSLSKSSNFYVYLNFSFAMNSYRKTNHIFTPRMLTSPRHTGHKDHN